MIQVQDYPQVVIQRSGKIRIGNPAHTRPFNIFLLSFAAINIALMIVVPFDWMKLISRMSNVGDALRHLMTIDFSEVDLILPFFYETVCVAVLATVYSAILGLFFGVFLAKNITPYKFFPPLLNAAFTFIRAVPSFIWVLLVLICLGFGPSPAIVGICIHSTAFFARAFAHSFEEVDAGTIEALETTGATRVKIFFSAILPSSLTSLIASLTMNFESNFHGASILGMVGAGGIGHIISMAFGSYRYGRAWMAVLTVVVFTYVFEIVFHSLKRKISV